MSTHDENITVEDFKYSPCTTLDGYSDDDLISYKSQRRRKITRKDMLLNEIRTNKPISGHQKGHNKRYHPYSPSITPDTKEPNSCDSVSSSRDNVGHEYHRQTLPISCRQKNNVLFIDPVSVKYLLGQIVINEKPGKLRVRVNPPSRRQKIVSRTIIFAAMFMLFLSILLVVVSLMMSRSIDDMVRKANRLLQSAVPPEVISTTLPSTRYIQTTRKAFSPNSLRHLLMHYDD